jgi:hypothetical protein
VTLSVKDHETHRHRRYSLTCAQFDGLLAACACRCQTCGVPSPETSVGKLFIDHDGRIGMWAVRGLLCPRCNSQVRYDLPVPDWAWAYVADPWYLRMLRAAGLSAEMPEPTSGLVRDFEGQLWRRVEDGWTKGGWLRNPWPWSDVLRRFGPHHLVAVA